MIPCLFLSVTVYLSDGLKKERIRFLILRENVIFIELLVGLTIKIKLRLQKKEFVEM